MSGKKQNDKWNLRLEELVKYLEENGRYPRCRTSLAFWVSYQRYAYTHNQLDEYRFNKLEEAGFLWRYDEQLRSKAMRESANHNYSKTWYTHYDELKAYLQEHGNLPTSGYLGCWLYQQKHKWNVGTLPDQYKNDLEKLGVKFWSNEKVQGSIILDRRKELGISRRELGLLLGMSDNNVAILERGKVSENRVEDILSKMDEAIAMVQKQDSEEAWQKNKRELVSYLANHQGNYPMKDSKLGKWVSQQRFLKECNELDNRRIRQLNDFGFKWEYVPKRDPSKSKDPKKAWEESFEEVRTFIAEHGVSPQTWDGQAGLWLYRQNYRYKHGRLPDKRAEMLREIGVELE